MFVQRPPINDTLRALHLHTYFLHELFILSGYIV